MPDPSEDATADEQYEFIPANQSLHLTIAKLAVSLQSSTGAKTDYQKHIRKNLGNNDFYLSGDVDIQVVWRMNHRKRYETADRPDIDNILKPILDSISGPDGIVFDDCQVMSVYSCWHDWQYDEKEELLVRIDYLDGDTISRGGILFVEIDRMLCLPIDLQLPEALQAGALWQCEMFFDMRKQFEKMNVANLSRYCAPIQRLFHKSRIQNFKISDFATEKKRLHHVWPKTSGV